MRAAEFPRSLSIASASGVTEPGSTSRPDRPSWIWSGQAPTLEATTGTPKAAAIAATPDWVALV
jgi:hypothetical protein